VGGFVVPGEGGVTTIAAEAGLDTVNELLLGELEKGAVVNAVGVLEGGGGRESPA